MNNPEPPTQKLPSIPQMALHEAWDDAQLWLTNLMCTGPDLTANAHLKLRHEAEEYAANPIVEEAADVVICLAGSAMSQGWTLNQLVTAIAVKVAVNRKRQWKQAQDGTWQHAPSVPERTDSSSASEVSSPNPPSSLNPVGKEGNSAGGERWIVRETSSGLDYGGQKTGWIMCGGRKLNETPIGLHHCHKFAAVHNASLTASSPVSSAVEKDKKS